MAILDAFVIFLWTLSSVKLSFYIRTYIKTKYASPGSRAKKQSQQENKTLTNTEKC
jgi:hypothetical protein